MGVCGVAWIDANTLLLGTNYGAGSMTSSGYARVIKRWTRGTPLSSASTVLEIPEDHVAAWVQTFDAGGRMYTQLTDAKTFYAAQQYLYVDGKTQKLETPDDADTYLVRDQIIHCPDGDVAQAEPVILYLHQLHPAHHAVLEHG